MSSRIIQQSLDLEEELARTKLKLKNAETHGRMLLTVSERHREDAASLENALVEALAKPIEQEKKVAVTFNRKKMFYAAAKEDSVRAAYILQTYDANERRTKVVIADLKAENSTLTTEATALCKSIGDVSLELAAAKLEASQHKEAATRLTQGINTLTNLSKDTSYINKEQQRTRESF